jgi:hypothetical protein
MRTYISLMDKAVGNAEFMDEAAGNGSATHTRKGAAHAGSRIR